MNMRRIMIVDDEVLVRVGLSSMMDWEEKGYTITGEASSGREALAKIRENPPDIVLTDLLMENMDGLELIKVLKKDYPAIQIIVLSCHDDFENVRLAMKLGADDYVYKLTLKPEELVKTLKELEGQPAEAAPAGSPVRNNDRIVFKNIDAIKSSLIKKAIEKNYSNPDSLIAELNEINIKVDTEAAYILMRTSVDDFYLFNPESMIKERELLKFSVYNIIKEIMQRFEQAEAFDYGGGDILVLVNSRMECGRESFQGHLAEAYEIIKEYLRRYLGVGISAGVSREYCGAGMIKTAYEEATEALNYRFFRGGGQLHAFIPEEETDFSERRAEALPEGLKPTLLQDLVEHLEEDLIKDFIRSYLAFVEASVNITIVRARGLMLGILYPFIKIAGQRGVSIDDITDECGFTPYQVITQYESIARIKVWFEGFVERFAALCRGKSEERCKREILKVKDFIRTNINREIKVSEAAAYINMSESYFSHFFKKETGISFIDYVNNQKIDKAKEMLLQTDNKIYEVAASMGFKNVNYFSMLFKKISGRSPNSYRN